MKFMPALLAVSAVCFSVAARANEYSAMWLEFDRADMSASYEEARGVLSHELKQADQQAGFSSQIAQDIRDKTLERMLALDTRVHRLDRMEQDLSDRAALYLGDTNPQHGYKRNNALYALERFYADHFKIGLALTTAQEESTGRDSDEVERLAYMRRIASYQVGLGKLQEAREEYEQMLPLITPKNVLRASERVELYGKYQMLLTRLGDQERSKDMDTLIAATKSMPDSPERNVRIRRAGEMGQLPPVELPVPAVGSPDAPASIVRPNQCEPQYPEGAAALNLRGTIKLEITVGEDGRLRAMIVKQTSGRYSLDEAVFEAIGKCEFLPALKDGKWRSGVIPLEFNLKPD